MRSRQKAFTLLELLAAITLLVILGTMLFQIFGKASEIVRVSNARQEIYQYARAALEFLEREISGAFTSVDANIDLQGGNTGIKGMRIYHNNSMGASCQKREGSQGIFFSTGIMARDTRETVGGNPNPFFGHDVNVARVAYYLNAGPESEPNDVDGVGAFGRLGKAAIHRAEMYDLTIGTPETGGPFVRNCLFFKLHMLSPFGGATQFQPMDWNSDATINVGGFVRRRGLPKAIYIKMRITDKHHATLYRWGDDPEGGSEKKWFVPGPKATKDYWGEEDPVVQTFSQVIYFGRRSD